MNIRDYSKDDKGFCSKLLKEQGIKEKDFVFEDDLTMVFTQDNGDIGFFSIRDTENVWVTHFIIDKKKRGAELARKSFSLMRELLGSWGIKKVVFSPPADDERFNRLIRLYFKVEPYAYGNESNYYLISL